jgi:hypothetical protein
MIRRMRLHMISTRLEVLGGECAPSVLLFLFFDLPALPAGRVAFCAAILVVDSGDGKKVQDS